MASLVARVTALAQAVAADIKALVAADATKAGKGANSDITSLSGLTTPLSLGQGGTGANDGATGIANLIGTPFLNAPTTRPTLRLDFVNRTHLDPRIVWARASAGTCYGADGLLQLVAANQPRFDHDPITRKRLGVLIEESRTNLVPFSEAPSRWNLTGSVVQEAAGLAPNGTLTASKLIGLKDAATRRAEVGIGARNVGDTCCGSLYVKAAELGAVRFRVGRQLLDESADFDLTAGTMTRKGANVSSAWLTPVGNGWFRLFIIVSIQATNSSQYFTVDPIAAGDGVSGFLLWGGQTEYALSHSSYMPTTVTWSARASTGTYFDSTGKLVTAGAGVARYGFKFDGQRWIGRGLVAEVASTNQLTYSEQLDNAAWSALRLSVTANAIAAPDGTTTADKLTQDTTESTTHQHSQSYGNFVSGTTYCFSVFVKAAEASRCQLALNGAAFSSPQRAGFNLANGAMGVAQGAPATTCENVGGGWWRISISAAATAAGGAAALIYLTDAAGNVSFTGDGASGIYAWGAQLEASTFPTSYIQTTTAAVQRVADTVVSAATLREADYPWMPTGAWYNPYEGSMFASGDLGQPNAYLWELTDGATFNRIIARGNGGTGIVGFQLVNGVVWSAGTNSVPVPLTLGAVRLTAQAWDRNSLTVVDQGFPGTANNTQQPTQCNQMRLGHSISGTVTSWLNGHLRQLHYYPLRLSGAELQGIAA